MCGLKDTFGKQLIMQSHAGAYILGTTEKNKLGLIQTHKSAV